MRGSFAGYLIFICILGCDQGPASTQQSPQAAQKPAAASQPSNSFANLLLVTFDTTRQDRIGCYGYGLARTTNVDRLAADGVRCTNAISTAPITAVAHASIFTGLNPPVHGVRDNGTYALAEDMTTLAEVLNGAGYATQALVSAIVLDKRYNLGQGFDGYDDQLEEEDAPPMFMIRDRPAARTADRAAAWIRQWRQGGSKAPFFLWVHFFDPHQPYEPRTKNRYLLPTQYDAEIAAADEGLGVVLDELKQAGEFDRTLTIITADHGESLGEHNEKTHAIFVYDATVLVPLVFRMPGKLPQGRLYDGPVRCIDIFPTALSLLGVGNKVEIQGVDLTIALRGDAPPPELPQYSESLLAELGFGMAPLHAVRHKGFKLIRAPRPELYDLVADPKELRNIIAENRSKAAEMNKLLEQLMSAPGGGSKGDRRNPLDQETAAALRALGYLGAREDRDSMAGVDPKDGILQYTKLENARHLCQAKAWKPAEMAVRDLLAEAPNNVSARNILALCLNQMDQIDEAEAEYRKSLEVDPRQNRVLHMIGQMRLVADDLDGAAEHFRAALAITPRFVEAMILLGFVEYQRGNTPAAAEWYERALGEDPDSQRVNQQYGDLYFVSGDYKAALEKYEKALAASPRSFEALMQAAVCHKRVGNAAKAVELNQRASDVRPDSWKPVYNLACIAALAGESESAKEHLQTAVERGLSDERLLDRDPDFENVRSQAWFSELKRAIEER